MSPNTKLLARVDRNARRQAHEMLDIETKNSSFVESIGRHEWYYRQLRAAIRFGRKLGIQEMRMRK